ncbi:DDHD domain-containing protein [Ophiocordyceps camponoti-floridani]|uniref:DDHD domain-containing protein n=1 Tax=Ophiocordyceps camponoti-floridani TaxID=2030778 RepID=A0A8H4Q700_9HYPO|nr:DDHD domain-containing protein [Ophiocordyceps camponoti-floridani]
MAAAKHTFATNCRLAPVRRASSDIGCPSLDARFFYSSLIPIDDPLSFKPGASGYEPKSSHRQLRPFGQGDNNALEKAWLDLYSETHRKQHVEARGGRDKMSTATGAAIEARRQLVLLLATRHLERHRAGSRSHNLPGAVGHLSGAISTSPCCPELMVDVSEELENKFCALVRKQLDELSPENLIHDVMTTMERLRKPAEASSEMRSGAPKMVSPNRPKSQHSVDADFAGSRLRPSKGKENCVENRPFSDHLRTPRLNTSHTVKASSYQYSPVPASASDDGMSRTPFARVEKVRTSSLSTSLPLPNVESQFMEMPEVEKDGEAADLVDATSQTPEAIKTLNTDDRAMPLEIVVGVSRLHKVSLPALQMLPIYWSPVNDVAVVMRATWFYRDTMIPVPPAVANQLEAGYQELRPWTETWADELRCAIEGQEQKQDEAEPTISSNPFCAARCCQGEAATQGASNPTLERPPREAPNRPFANYHVIYKDKSDAYLLKQSLKPSAYYGRKPVTKIMRGIAIGIPVTRGFDQQTWDSGKRQPRPPETPVAEASPESAATAVCSACKADASRGQINDLVLVAHGIGQKFAERVESFHFTHAINAFRRAVNTDMSSPSIQAVVRKGQTGLMILPLNWRMGLSFEDGGPLQQGDVTASFALKDIEPGTIPAVRSIMSDVMFDIPFYMSHHKGKMIKALVSEANRVYRLWCINNPGFSEKGRVHLIAHSLGSVMALDILSHQPTIVPRLDLTREPSSRHFEFDTKNLFLLGSPAAFFLLLERKALVPRRGRRKPGADAADTVTKNVVGDVGTMGCLAVDNIYNVLAKEDPVAYLLNGAVDANFSASLKTAYVPSTSTSFLKSVTDAVRNVVPGLAPASTTPLDRPPTMRLPSQLELEVHDFTREEVAEKKAFLLNDNGQIDWVLRSGGGPLELQYLNMLSAHTSYWTSQDLIRMLCIEVGREPGRASSLPAMRAVKAARRFTQ